MIQRLTFTRPHRLKLKRDFDKVFAARCTAGSDSLVVHAAPNALDISRLGLAVSRRVGNAVHRNRIKRALRQAFRLAQHDLPPGFDFVCVAKPTPNGNPTNTAAEFPPLALRAAERFERRRNAFDRRGQA